MPLDFSKEAGRFAEMGKWIVTSPALENMYLRLQET